MSTKTPTVHEELVAALSIHPLAEDATALGEQIGHLYTDKGLPLDMALAELKKRGMPRRTLLLVLLGACSWFTQHKRNSGATDKAIERQRNMNNRILADYFKTGETGLY